MTVTMSSSQGVYENYSCPRPGQATPIVTLSSSSSVCFKNAAACCTPYEESRTLGSSSGMHPIPTPEQQTDHSDVVFRIKEQLLPPVVPAAEQDDDPSYEVQGVEMWVGDEVHYDEPCDPVYETIPGEGEAVLSLEAPVKEEEEETYSFTGMIAACKNRLSGNWGGYRKNRHSLGDYAGYVGSQTGIRRLKKRLSTGKNQFLGSFTRKTPTLRPNKSEPIFYIRPDPAPSSNSATVDRKTRRRSSATKSAIVRPKEAPPDPPTVFVEAASTPETDNSIEEVYCSYLFASEPLYHQFYDEIGFKKTTPRASTMALLSSPNSSSEEGSVLKRTLWSELSEVSELLPELKPSEISYQEALFEVITSEASYLKSLNVFISHFMSSKELEASLERREYNVLFSDIVTIRQVSEKFFFELDAVWQRSLYLEDLLPVIEAHSRRDFKTYVKYTGNQVYQDRLLSVKLGDEKFRAMIRELESSPLCESLSLHSFLLLPMQRITRYPLLLSAILKFIPSCQKENIAVANAALTNMNDLVHKCNESARQMERLEVMLKLSSCFDFKDHRSIPLLSPGRWLLRKTHVLRLDSSLGEGLGGVTSSSSKPQTLSNKFKLSKTHLYLFLFTDLLVIVKQKSDDHYKVIDHCPRNLLCMSEEDLPSNPESADNTRFNLRSSSASSSSTAAWLSLLQNHEGKTHELLISFDSDSEISAWRDLLHNERLEPSGGGEVIYEAWDCPTVQAVEDILSDGGELIIPRGAKGRLRRRKPDGSVHVEKMDEAVGGGGGVWVSSTTVQEVHSDHVAAKHIRQRYKFLKLVAMTP